MDVPLRLLRMIYGRFMKEVLILVVMDVPLRLNFVY